MLTVDDYGAIRRARRDGKSIRQIAREFDHSRNTIRKVLKHPEPSATTRNRFAPKLGPFHGIIDQILLDDETARPSSDIPRHRCSVAFAMNTTTAVATPKCNAICSSTADGNRRHSSRWGIFQASASKQISAISTSISPTDAGLFHSWSPPGPTQIIPSCWLCPSNEPRQSLKGWSRPLSSSAVSPRKSGGITPKQSQP